jgi:hypothetical protein
MAAGTGRRITFVQSDVRPHIVSIGNNGQLRTHGTYGTQESEVRSLFERQIPEATKDWGTRRILLYAHGGLTDEDGAVQRVADYRSTLLEREVYPVSFIWKTDFWTTLSNILQDALSRRRPEGLLDAAKDFMLNRLDDAMEPLARQLSGKAQWDEMKENARLATVSRNGGARLAAGYLARLVQNGAELHLVSHSAGSIFQAPLVQLLTTSGKIATGPLKGSTGLGLKIATCTLWAPACTIELFKQTYLPAIQNGAIEHFSLFTLTDQAEQDDHCANIYHKSLLYLVSNAFEAAPRIPLLRPDGVPLLGMEKFVRADATLRNLFSDKRHDWVLAPNTAAADSAGRSAAAHHGDFDDDGPTLQATLARILGQRQATNEFVFYRSASSLRDRRRRLPSVANGAVR